MSKKLVIVESPTKAKTITKFLNEDYQILSSFGHVRDLPKSQIGVDVENDFEPTYTVPTKSKKHVTELKRAAKQADEVLLATDEDREGEAIAWHVASLLKIKPEKIKRIAFHEITRHAILNALESPRDLNQNLVDAQQARRILDRLVGYELSPFLWQKVRRGLSAGRVQSVAVRLIVERERERMAFNVEEFWTVDAEFEKQNLVFPAKLTTVDGKKLEKLDIKNEKEAHKIAEDLKGAEAKVLSINKKQVSKAPPTPYTTSTLQIDAHNKLSMSAKQIMALAQQLYETGRITYMRTDSMNLSEKFLTEAQKYIKGTFGEKYTEGPKRYKTKKKGAQEAHEAIRPTSASVEPESLKGTLDDRQWKIYNLIWQRSIASQMPAAKLDRTGIDLKAKQYVFRANGSTISFDGFMKVYHSAKEKILPELKEGDDVKTKSITPNQHFTEPPARYSDASLVKVLEEHEIGRPSPYAPTISTIIDREYVERDDNKKLAPTDIAMIVNDLLVDHFKNVVDYEFTANLEKQLDDIAEGSIEWAPMLKAFYKPFHDNLEVKTKELDREDIMPDRHLGEDPKTKLPVIVRSGRFGGYVQLGEWPEEDRKAKINKPKSASLLKGMHIESVTLEQALSCLVFPKSLGKNESNDEIMVAIGRFGPYIKAGEVTASIKEPLSPATITKEEAIELLKTSAELKKKMATPIKEFGNDPESGEQILIKHGRYGPYITDGTTNASLGKKLEPEEVTEEIAIEMLKKKREKGPGRGAKKKTKAKTKEK